ncbi:hypothetical protein HDU93_003820, partial [Gonapodya sp. JEL0774]
NTDRIGLPDPPLALSRGVLVFECPSFTPDAPLTDAPVENRHQKVAPTDSQQVIQPIPETVVSESTRHTRVASGVDEPGSDGVDQYSTPTRAALTSKIKRSNGPAHPQDTAAVTEQLYQTLFSEKARLESENKAFRRKIEQLVEENSEIKALRKEKERLESANQKLATLLHDARQRITQLEIDQCLGNR